MSEKPPKRPAMVGGLMLPGVRSQRDVALMLGVTRAAVQATEERALRKLRRAWIRMYGMGD